MQINHYIIQPSIFVGFHVKVKVHHFIKNLYPLLQILHNQKCIETCCITKYHAIPEVNTKRNMHREQALPCMLLHIFKKSVKGKGIGKNAQKYTLDATFWFFSLSCHAGVSRRMSCRGSLRISFLDLAYLHQPPYKLY